MSTRPTSPRRRRWLFALAGALALTGFTFWLAPAAPAQAKKKGAKPPAKEAKETKQGKGKDDQPFTLPTPKFTDSIETKYGGLDQINLINKAIEKGWIDNKVMPSDRCTDYEFVRRAFLDIVGRIPARKEIDRFMKDPPTRRRSMLIDRLLESTDKSATGKEYRQESAENLATQWTVLLLTRSGSRKAYQEQLQEWLASEFLGPTGQSENDRADPDWSKTVTRLLTATGETNKNPAVNYVLHHLGEEIKQDRAANGAWDMVPVTSRTTKLFLGIRTQCVQCHDHPFSGDLGQHQFWGINAFFRQVETNGRPGMAMRKKKAKLAVVQQFEVKDNPLFNAKGLVPYERRNGVLLYTDPTFLDGKKLLTRGTKNVNRRQALAKFITKDPSFAKVFVNRMWGHFMGKSFTKDAVDDFGEHNPISHPELLDKLAEDWATKYQHNPKALIRWICNSRSYGLSSVANKNNDKSEDETLFARMLLKPMTPEQLFESIMIATQAKVGEIAKDKQALRDRFLNGLVVNFGNDEGGEGSYNGTVVQALLLMNGQEINQFILDKENGTVAHVLKLRAFSRDAAPRALNDLFLAALSRPPSRKEVNDLLYRKDMFFMPRSRQPMNTPQFWTGYYQDIFWALINSNEFILGH